MIENEAPERKHAVDANLNVPELTKAGSRLELYIHARDESSARWTSAAAERS